MHLWPFEGVWHPLLPHSRSGESHRSAPQCSSSERGLGPSFPYTPVPPSTSLAHRSTRGNAFIHNLLIYPRTKSGSQPHRSSERATSECRHLHLARRAGQKSTRASSLFGSKSLEPREEVPALCAKELTTTSADAHRELHMGFPPRNDELKLWLFRPPS